MTWLLGILASIGTIGSVAGGFIAWREASERRKESTRADKEKARADHLEREYIKAHDQLAEGRRRHKASSHVLREQAARLKALASECAYKLPVDDAVDLANSMLSLADEAARGADGDPSALRGKPATTASAVDSVEGVRGGAVSNEGGDDRGDAVPHGGGDAP